MICILQIHGNLGYKGKTCYSDLVYVKKMLKEINKIRNKINEIDFPIGYYSEDDLYIIFIVPIDFDEEKYSLHLKKRKLDENEILPMLMEKINKLNNNNAIVKTKFNEIEKQVNTISRKNNDKNGSRNDINPELKIIKEQLNDINGKLYGTKKSNNKMNNNHINGKNIMLNSYISAVTIFLTEQKTIYTLKQIKQNRLETE